MRYYMALLSMGGLVLSGTAAAECTDEQRARMIRSDISEEKIAEICGDNPEDRQRHIEINVNNTNINRNAPGNGSTPAEALQVADETTRSTDRGSFKPVVVGIQGSNLRYGTKSLFGFGDGDEDDDHDDDDHDDDGHDDDDHVAGNGEEDLQYDGAMKGAFARVSFTENWAVQGSYYRGKLNSGDANGSTEVNGYTGHLLLGSNFGYSGGNAYLGVGGFKEEWSGWPDGNTSHQGLSGLVGLEYKWDHVMVAVEGAYRQPDSFGDALAERHSISSSDVSAYTATAKIGFRFGG